MIYAAEMLGSCLAVFPNNAAGNTTNTPVLFYCFPPSAFVATAAVLTQSPKNLLPLERKSFESWRVCKFLC